MSEGFTIKIPARELNAAMDKLHKYGDNDDVIRRAITRATFRVEAKAKQLAPVKFGRLRSAIVAKVKGLTGTISVNVDYAGAVEFGTKPHIIKPKTKKALAFKPGGGFRFWDESGRVVLKSVKHPGTKAQPYLVPAMKSQVKPLTNAIKKILEDVK